MPDRLTAAELAELERLEKSATPYPWLHDAIANAGANWLIGVINTGVDRDGKAQHIVTTDGVRASQCFSGGAEDDARFIAAIRNAAPALIAAARTEARLRAALLDVRTDTEMQLHDAIVDPVIRDTLIALCEAHGYGNVIASASTLWRRKDPRGAFLFGPCAGIGERNLKLIDAALAEPAEESHGD